MTSETDITAAEARCTELYAFWQKADVTAAFHERHDHADADTFRSRADAWKADYEAAVRDLRRLRAAATATHAEP